MCPTYMSSHHVLVVADTPLDAAEKHHEIQAEQSALVYEVCDAETSVLSTVDLETGSVTELLR